MVDRNSKKNDAANGDPTVELGPPVELEVVMLAFGTPPADLDKVLEEVNKIALAETNTTVNFNIMTPASYKEQVRLMLASSEPMDLFLDRYAGFAFLSLQSKQRDRVSLFPLMTISTSMDRISKRSLGRRT